MVCSSARGLLRADPGATSRRDVRSRDAVLSALLESNIYVLADLSQVIVADVRVHFF